MAYKMPTFDLNWSTNIVIFIDIVKNYVTKSKPLKNNKGGGIFYK